MITIGDIHRRLDVSLKTIHEWRQPSRQREALPYRRIQRGAGSLVEIDETEFVDWLGKYRPDLLPRWNQC